MKLPALALNFSCCLLTGLRAEPVRVMRVGDSIRRMTAMHLGFADAMAAAGVDFISVGSLNLA
jgi:hypothetical protein